MKKYFFKYKALLSVNIIFIVACSIMEILIAFMIKSVIDTGNGTNVTNIYKVSFLSIIFILIMYILNYFRIIFQAKYIKRTLITLKKDIFQNIIQKDIRSFNDVNSASYISTLTNDITIIESDYFISILNLITNVTRLILGSIAIFMINIYIAICIFAMAFLNLLVPVIFSKKVINLKKSYSDALSDFTIKVKDIFSGFEIIKSFNVENKLSKEYDKFNLGAENSKYNFLKLNSFVDIISGAFGFLVFFTALAVGTYFVFKGELTYGLLIAAVQLMNNITTPIANISSIFNKIKSVKAIEQKISSLTDNKECKKLLKEKHSFNKEIVFNNVNFSYNDERKVLNNISMKIEKGKKYALVGDSGSGKSTILKLLLGYYEDFKGEISIDGLANRDINSSDLYKLISVIQQNVFIFDDTVKENITLFKDYSSECINRAVKLSGLDELIDSLPNGIDSEVGENGCNISGGEKQRIAIARALIKNTPILILDEATSSLDNKTSFSIENSILDLDDLTCIVITHKLNEDLLRKYDEVIVLKNGQICEAGNFDKLIENKQYFYSLYNVAA
ncbi:ABC transporter ATP-binding protein [Clostridium sp. YIM B02515]|uniref:ABC transporter ATP-binding protein n=1 Tax=Clostridium rhizosphaerae TaxID=2803861 RepID=A0ABS1TEB8_9CLOT|nr:ABC transporter ATP-binding protein [Clostridium rhizosphaerae]MBL4937726.1 ABC transporter ATP-binding protein [Clostridium rhizosphaerae]